MNNALETPRVIFGGTFDPVHNGHLAVATAAAESLKMPDVALMPCYSPPHKPKTKASAHHRIAMLERAIADCNARTGTQLWIERWEINQTGPSWTTKTLEHFHNEGQHPIIFIMGMDTFRTLSSWREPERFMELVNLWIIQRDQVTLKGTRKEEEWLNTYNVDSPSELKSGTGRLFVSNMPTLKCSSSQVRSDIATAKQHIDVPAVVLEYIEKHQLYRDSNPRGVKNPCL